MALVSAAEPYKFSERIRFRGKWKENVPLSQQEFQRQGKLIDQYLEYGLFNNAVGLMREVIVSRVFCEMTKGGPDSLWLKYKGRKVIQDRLNALVEYCKSNKPSCKDLKNLADCWRDLSKSRNELHHHGMKEDEVVIENEDQNASTISDIWSTLKGHLEDDDFWHPVFGGGSGKVLISSLGLSPGLLFSALKNVEPEQCLLVTSEKALFSLDEITKRAEYNRPYTTLAMKDPWSGFEEINDLVLRARDCLASADEVVCNATGGTTAMQYAIQRLAESAKSLGRDVRWVAMIDRRPPENQRAEPYVVGEMMNLNGDTSYD